MVVEYKLGTKLPLAAASEGVGSLALGIFPPFINRRQAEGIKVIETIYTMVTDFFLQF